MQVSVLHGSFPLGIILVGIIQAASGSTVTTGALVPRQSSVLDPSQIPSQCQDACNSVVNDANTCTTFRCICTPQNDADVLSCVDCVLSANHSGPVIVNGQDILNQYASECNLNNVSVSSLSASGVATVTGISTSNLNPSVPPIPPSSTPVSQTSQSASATSPSPSLTLPTSPSATPSPSGTPSLASAVIPSVYLWPSCVTVVAIIVTLTMA
ncbi:hypothetical protein DFH07DRAFT_286407 [Mycena maculata]|uniref:Extracellular membrane protein CFEM domain-containing protein n=1 Tax=Mycena maculata TaxID=230809 RepID=A0AAD7ML56_9AGAR|nr:hypothetical protein DFH07DRAFT_286407 [Mycena maculata]